MENVSHSLPKKSYRSNGFAGKTVYDDVFGGPPKLGVHTLSPRVEDYSEIFEGFHASRGSSIPILDLPAVDDDDDADLFFDVRSSEFNYSEVFGSFNGLDFAVSYEELFKQSTRGDDSSDEAWTPAQSESLSDESDPSAYSEKNQSLSYGDLHNSLDGTKQFNISYHKAAPKGKEDMLNGVTHVTQLDAIPGYSFIVNETLRAQKIEDENSHLRINQNTDFGGGVTEGKRLRKTVSQPPNSDFGVQEYESEPNPLAGHDKASSPHKAFISVSDISLRTQPSHLPPPSRPPPAFTDRKGNSSRLNSKLKASKSYAFERMESDSSPPYFDVEIDASSSAAASAAAMKNAVEKAQAQLRSAKELMERKEGLQCRTKLHLENDLEHDGKKTSRFDRFNSCKGEGVQSACEREGKEMKTYAAGQRKKVRNTTHVTSGAIDGEDHIDIAGKSVVSDYGKEHTSSQVSHKTEGTVAWREETQFYEVVKPTKVKDKKTLEQHSKSHDCGPQEKGTGGALEQQEYNKRTKEARVDHEWEENGEQFEELKGVGGQVENKGRRVAAKGSTMQEEHQEKENLAQKVGEWQEKEKKTRVSSELGETERRLNELDKREDCIILTEDQLEANEVISEQKLKGVHERVEYEKRIKKAHERKGRGREIKETFNSEEYERELKEDVERVGNGRKLKKALELGAKAEREKEVCGREEIEKKPEEAHEIGQKKEKWEEALGPSGKAKRSKEVIEQEESGNRLQVDLKPQENKKEKYWACEERNEKNSKVALEQEKNTKKQEKVYEVEETEKRLINDCERDETEKRLKEAWKQEEINKRPREAHESDESEKGAEVMFKEEGTEDGSKEANERVDCNKRIKDDNNCDGFSGLNSAHEQIKREETDRNLNQEIFANVEVQKVSDGACTDSPQATRVARHDKIHGNLETQKAPLCEENGRLRTEPKICEREMEVVEKKIELIEGRFDSYEMNQSDSQHEKTNNKTKDSKVSLCLHDSVAKSKEDGDDIGGIHIVKSKGVSEIASDTENAYIITNKHREGRKNINGVQIASDQGENRDKFASSHVVREWVQHGRKVGDVLPAQKFDSQSPERKETNFNEKLTLEEREKEERLKRERDLEDDRLRKIEEEKEREREREKDRMAVDTATREARERALAEARDRAERAAVERATAEVRQRALADARERLEKASAEARERLTAEKVSTEARIKAERAAVERATYEARERAFEKAMAEKASFAAHERMERSVSDNFLAYSSNGGLRHSSSSSDLQYGVGSSRELKYSYSSVSGLEAESAQRCKARLERHQRTAERAAKALAEKNMRDLLAHKEQAERNRLAESLDADVKRWSSGKEGNLRALLSTLQYILGHDSGWKPIPLTDVITAVAAKKAYRKATLFVHPDKLQQRGASIQQKYICEKVFDLLKEAWNKFNSEER